MSLSCRLVLEFSRLERDLKNQSPERHHQNTQQDTGSSKMKDQLRQPHTVWRKCWFTGDPVERRKLWREYDYDFKKYFDAYRPSTQTLMLQEEEGMAAFVKMEERLTRQNRILPYRKAGQEALQDFIAAFTTKDAPRSNIVLLALDIEGNVAQKGVFEVGLASIDSRVVAAATEGLESFKTTNFATRKNRERKFMHGPTIRVDSGMMAKAIIDHIQTLSREANEPRIVLICHGLLHELRTLDDLGVHLEDLPITGVVDTHELGRTVLGKSGSLEQMLNMTAIPTRQNSLHCAGNDAHYTLQVVLALLATRSTDEDGRLGQIARHALPIPTCWAEADDTPSEQVDCVDEALALLWT